MISHFGNEFLSLRHLSQGLGLLCHAVKKLEDRAQKQVKEGKVFDSMPREGEKDFLGKDVKYFCFGNAPAFEWVPLGLLYCYFQWYAVSACNYVLLVGWLARQGDPSRRKPWEYVSDVIPDVRWFRDKIAAHFARAGKKDKRADQILSTMYQVCFENGRFRASPWQVTLKTKGDVGTSTGGNSWSLTEVHENIRKRYNPQKSEDDISS